MVIGEDFSIAAGGDIRYTGPSDGAYSVIELHRYLAYQGVLDRLQTKFSIGTLWEFVVALRTHQAPESRFVRWVWKVRVWRQKL